MSSTTVTRRDVLKGAGALGLGALAGRAPAAPRADQRRPPNVVIVFCDDLGYGDLGCYDSTLIRTPVLDAMARRGMRFTDFYAGQPSCTPSRTALLTGRYAPRANLGVVLQPTNVRGLAKQELTMPEYLKTRGYATGHFGKWHLGNPRINPEWHPMEHGFDRHFGVPYSNDQRPLSLYDDRTIIEEPPEQAPLTRRFTEQAIAFMRAAPATSRSSCTWPRRSRTRRSRPSAPTCPAAASTAIRSRRSTATWASCSRSSTTSACAKTRA